MRIRSRTVQTCGCRHVGAESPETRRELRGCTVACTRLTTVVSTVLSVHYSCTVAFTVQLYSCFSCRRGRTTTSHNRTYREHQASLSHVRYLAENNPTNQARLNSKQHADGSVSSLTAHTSAFLPASSEHLRARERAHSGPHTHATRRPPPALRAQPRTPRSHSRLSLAPHARSPSASLSRRSKSSRPAAASSTSSMPLAESNSTSSSATMRSELAA